MLHELVLGRRRVDMLAVSPHDLRAIEVKGPRDSLSDGRLAEQLKEFSIYMPEVWLIADVKWIHHKAIKSELYVGNVGIHDRGKIEVPKYRRHARDARRDDLCCSRLLELLWHSETLAIAKRSTVAYEAAPGLAFPTRKVKGMLARMLTGHEIVKEVCAELRKRPLVGMQSDPAIGGARLAPSAGVA